MRTPTLLAFLSGCCGGDAELELLAPEGAHTDLNEVWEIDLAEIVLSSRLPLEELGFEVEAGDHLDVGVQGTSLYAIPETDWGGREPITLRVTDKCDDSAEITFDLGVGALGGDCTTTLTYRARANPTGVAVAGSFNEWGRTPMVDQGDGTWSVDLPLAEGAYPYKIVETAGAEQWSCDPDGAYFQCDEGYARSSWNDCALGAASCNSLLVVADCHAPSLALDAFSRGAGSAGLTISFAPGQSGDGVGSVAATLDGEPIAEAAGWDGASPLSLSLTGLSPTRHTVRVRVTDAGGRQAEELYVPFWTDDLGWDRGLLYYAFVDRFADGDGDVGLQGASHAWTDYMGGDWQGLVERLDYLEEVGVTAIWITAPLDNAEGVWGDKCHATYTGYHGYWPSSSTEVEEQFGDAAMLHQLVDEAHARNIRVLVDWVANHVHEDHPYATDHPDWYNPERLCRDANNWNDIPETCWFDPFLPDVDYYRPEPLQVMVDDAVRLAKEYGFDGYRVDAVKHMPHPVYWNFQTRVRAEIEHTHAGLDEDFYTVGETFDGDRGLIASYVNERELDAQFDFPLYFTLRAAFTDQSASLLDLQSAWEDSREAFAGFTMSTFLGNHDVDRFVTVADVGAWGECSPDQYIWDPAEPPSSDVPYRELKLAWTWLLTHEGLPLIYYGDEVGMPGHADPDNRHMMRFDGELSANEADVLDHVSRLGQARLDHPQLAVGDEVVWWEEADVMAWARTSPEGDALVVVNRSWADRTLSNGLSWAGLPSGQYLDVLSGETFSSSGDTLSIPVGAMESRVLVAM